MSSTTIGQGLFDFFASGMVNADIRALQSQLPLPRSVSEESWTLWKVTTYPSEIRSLDGYKRDTEIRAVSLGLYFLLVLSGAYGKPINPMAALDTKTSSKWMTWIGTLARLNLVECVSDHKISQAYKEIPEDVAVSLAALTYTCQAHILNHRGEDPKDVDPIGYEGMETMIKDVIQRLGLPDVRDFPSSAIERLCKCTTYPQQAAYYALVVFQAGRPVSVDTNGVIKKSNSVSVARPKNLEDKFNNGKEWMEISGPLQTSKTTIISLAKVWEMYAQFRTGYLLPLLPLADTPSGITHSILGTMVKMLKYAQMAHVRLIYEFCSTYRFVVDMPEFAAETFLLASDSKKWAAFPSIEQSYVKVLYRDQAGIFDSKSLMRLSSLARDVMMETRGSLGDYELAAADPLLRARFDALNPLTVAPVARAPVVSGEEEIPEVVPT